MKTLLCGTTAALNHLLDSTHVSSQWERCSCDILAPSCFPVIPLPYLGGTYCRAVQSSHTSGHCFHVKRQKRRKRSASVARVRRKFGIGFRGSSVSASSSCIFPFLLSAFPYSTTSTRPTPHPSPTRSGQVGFLFFLSGGVMEAKRH